MAKTKAENLESDYIQLERLIDSYLKRIDESNDEGERRMLTDELEILYRIKRENHANKFERRMKILGIGLQVAGIALPAIMTGIGFYVNRRNLINLLEYETHGSITSFGGKIIVPKAIK